jgi:DNA adenine methylase
MSVLVKSPVTYFGGKQKLVEWIEGFFPPHKKYIEVFGGGGSIVIGKVPSIVDVYNDIDENIVNMFKVIQCPDMFAEFYKRILFLPYSRHIKVSSWERCINNRPDQYDPISHAVDLYVTIRQGFSGTVDSTSWSYGVKSPLGLSAWNSSKAQMKLLHDRLSHIKIESMDFLELIDKYDDDDSLFYLDPPYIMDTRRGGEYLNEIDDSLHVKMVDKLLSIKGNAVVSGYDHQLYDALVDNGWYKVHKEVVADSAGRTKKTGLKGLGTGGSQTRVETLWISPGCGRPVEYLMKSNLNSVFI